MKEGRWAEWQKNGQHRKEENFNYGNEVGYWDTGDDTGQKVFEINSKNNKKWI